MHSLLSACRTVLLVLKIHLSNTHFQTVLFPLQRKSLLMLYETKKIPGFYRNIGCLWRWDLILQCCAHSSCFPDYNSRWWATNSPKQQHQDTFRSLFPLNWFSEDNNYCHAIVTTQPGYSQSLMRDLCLEMRHSVKKRCNLSSVISTRKN